MTVRVGTRSTCLALLLIALAPVTNGWASGYSAVPSLGTVLQTGVSHESPVLTRGASARLSSEPERSATEALLDKIRVSSKRQAAEAAYYLGLAAMERLDLASADLFHREAVHLDPENLSYLQAIVATAYLSGKFDEALEYQTKALVILQRELGYGDPRVAGMLDRLGAIYGALLRYEDAETQLRQSLTIREKGLGQNHPAVAVSLNLMASLAMNRNRPAEAEAFLQRSVQILRDSSGPKSADAAAAIYNLAELYRKQERFTEAKELYDQAVAIWEDSTEEDSLNLAATRFALGKLYLAQRRLEDARSQFELTLSILQNALGSEHPYVIEVLESMTTLQDERRKSASTENIYQALVDEFGARSSAD